MRVLRTSLLIALLTACGGLVRAQTSPTLLIPTANLTLAAGASAAPINLTQLFGLPSVTGTVVQMQTNLGPINIELQPAASATTVNNFLSYVNKGAYTNTIIHRIVPTTNSGIGIVQGGGFTVTSGSTAPTTIPTSAAIPLEYNTTYPNVRGTIAMARTNDPNSATDQWFFNSVDNTYNLGSGTGGGYAVFGRVIGSGMTIVDTIDKLPPIQVPGLDSSNFAAVPAYNYSAAVGFSYANWVRVTSVTVIPIYPSSSTATSVLSFSATSNDSTVATAAVSSGTTLTITGVAAGSTYIVVTATDTNGDQATGVYNITVAPSFAISQQPTDEIVSAGSTAVLSVAANTSAGTTYQWKLNGAAITATSNSSASSSHLVISPAAAANVGSYSCVVTGSNGTILTSSSANLTLSSTADVGRLTNLSVLSSDVTANQDLTIGFVVGGTATPSLTLLLRGAGPALSAFNITDAIPDPTITLFDKHSTILAVNQGWASTSANQSAVTAAQSVTGFPFVPANLDSAMVQTLASSSYTFHLRSASGKSGSVLGELYDDSAGFTAGNAHLTNLSSTVAVGSGHALTAGFYITGSTAKTVLLRGIGPTLSLFGLPSPMADPQLTLVSTTGTTLATNIVWGGDSQIAAISSSSSVLAFALSPTSADSVILITLPPGGYTAQVTSASGAGGNALVEVYEVP